MTGLDLVLDALGAAGLGAAALGAAALGAAGLAIGAVLRGRALRQSSDARLADLIAQLDQSHAALQNTEAASSAFDSAVLSMREGQPALVSGPDGLDICAKILGLDTANGSPCDVLDALNKASPDAATHLGALFDAGQACQFEVQGQEGIIGIEGRVVGALAWLRLTPAIRTDMALPTAARFAAFLDDQNFPVWITGQQGLAGRRRCPKPQ